MHLRDPTLLKGVELLNFQDKILQNQSVFEVIGEISSKKR
jgi:hypothetical protein